MRVLIMIEGSNAFYDQLQSSSPLHFIHLIYLRRNIINFSRGLSSFSLFVRWCSDKLHTYKSASSSLSLPPNSIRSHLTYLTRVPNPISSRPLIRKSKRLRPTHRHLIHLIFIRIRQLRRLLRGLRIIRHRRSRRRRRTRLRHPFRLDIL
jgi:hypothetical protein